jgi:hypothetical protein
MDHSQHACTCLVYEPRNHMFITYYIYLADADEFSIMVFFALGGEVKPLFLREGKYRDGQNSCHWKGCLWLPNTYLYMPIYSTLLDICTVVCVIPVLRFEGVWRGFWTHFTWMAHAPNVARLLGIDKTVLTCLFSSPWETFPNYCFHCLVRHTNVK